ncbi:MAG: phosphatidate cytidylyltransferase [Bryobacterales bacterium]|nr:phosphatidate cytidylyltransferase [Bryobacteraceae bacterium]MDW8131517.1 phosphatidate cytidylyltransferase [Bryobacterales bacterium]
MKRVLTAFALVPITVLLVVRAPALAFTAAVALVACLSYREYENLVNRHGLRPPGPLGYGAGIVLLAVPGETAALGTLLALLALVAAMRERPLACALPRASALAFGLLWIFGAWRCGVALHARDPYWLLFVLVLNWIGDTAAYYFGKALGRHKLAPEVSPAKSWEGAIASAVFALAAGWAYAHLVWPAIPAATILLASAVCNLTGQLGDLAESAVKRGAGVKDSGSVLPGHGGWLDRTDGLLFSMPAVYLLLDRLSP